MEDKLNVLAPEVAKVDEVDKNNLKVVLEPFERGFGYTIGHSLRRIMLSYMPGAAVTEVKIDGVSHEYGTIEEKLNTVFDDDNFKTYDYRSDSLLTLSALREVLLDNEGRLYIEAVLDGQEKVLEKNVYYYDERGRISEIRQYDMIRRGRTGNREIPIRVNTYEYD